MSQAINSQKEQVPLKISMWGTLFMAALGFFFAIYTSSQAILLDGILSLVNFIVVLLSMKVASQVVSPSTSRFPFGFLQLEPLFNFFRGFILLGVLAFASFSAVTVIIEGGSDMVLGIAVIYAIVATVGCFLIYFVIRSYYRKNPTSILDLEMKGWLIDGILSSVVLLTFLIGYLIRGGALASYLPYLDSAIVIIISLIMLPVPYKILKNNLFELLLSSPPHDIKSMVEQIVLSELKNKEVEKYDLKITKTGRSLYVYVLVYNEKMISVADQMRNEIEKQLMNKGQTASVLIELTLDESFFKDVQALHPTYQFKK